MIDPLDYTVIRSSRRSLAIEINRNGEILVRAPKSCPQKTIDEFLLTHEKWIHDKSEMIGKLCEQRKDFLKDHSSLPFLGEILTVRYYDGKAPCRQEKELFLPASRIKSAFIAWRHTEAEQILLPKVNDWAQFCHLMPGKLRFGDEKARWGSMGSNGTMCLNTALLHLTPEQIDYVIVHELCHLLYPNHSSAFHAEVSHFLPEANRLRKEIKAAGAPLQPNAFFSGE